MCVQVGVKTHDGENPPLPWLGRAGNLTSPCPLGKRDGVQPYVLGRGLEGEGAQAPLILT